MKARKIFCVVLTVMTIGFWFCPMVFARSVDSEFAKKLAQIFVESETSELIDVYQTGNSDQIADAFSSVTKISKFTPLYKDDEGKEILAYIAELEPSGYVVVSPDTNIYPVIAYSYSGKFPFDPAKDNPMLDLVRWDMSNRLKAIPSLPAEKLSENENSWTNMVQNPPAKMSQRDMTTWGPWIKTTWDQGSYYNQYVPKLSGQGMPVGCTATAMAQIINYWKWPKSVFFESNDRYSTDTLGINIDDDFIAYDFLTFEQLNQKLSNIQYNGNTDEIAALCFASGVSVKMDYKIGGSGAYVNDVPKALTNKFKYSNAARWKYSSASDFYDALKSNMKEGKPAELTIYVYDGIVSKDGHAIVADGYKTTTAEYYHLNFGWGPDLPNPLAESWYYLPDGMPEGYNVIYGAAMYIYPPTLASVSISGPSSIKENAYGDYKATAIFVDADTNDVTTFVTWSENSAYASLDTSVKGKLKTAAVSSNQTVTLTAKYTYNGVIRTASMPVTIVPKILTSVTVTGASSIKGGSYSDYTATAVFDDGTTQDVTNSVVWTENSAYASMDSVNKGRMKTTPLRTEQTVTLTARYTYKTVAKTASVPVTITVPPALISVSVSGTDRVNENSSADYKAVAFFEDGTSQDITVSAAWTENSAYASMDTSVKGRLKTGTVASGQSVTLTARYTFNGVTQAASMPITIAPKILDSVTVTGASSVMGGASGDYKVTAVFADGTSQNVTSSAVWSENSAYAYMDTATKGRLKTVSVSSGQTVTLTVRYTYKTVTKTASVPIPITVPSPLKEVSITGPPALNESSYGDYTATAVCEDGSSIAITAFAVWTENSAYASMDTVVKGRLKTVAVSADQNLTLTVRYTLNGVTKTTSMPVLIRSKNSLPLFFEFETLMIKETFNIPYVDVQDMSAWGSEQWSGGKQLFCGAGANQGSIIKLLLPVNKSGRYTFDLYATKAPDFSQIQTMIDGKQIGSIVDLYDPYVIPSGKISLGIIDLSAGTHELSFIVVGKNSASSNYSFGLDALSLSSSL